MDQVSQVREKIDIVAFISQYVPLKKIGNNFTAVCPFHTEKTPSFVVSPQRQIWHCFGCQKGGDVFTFFMEYEHIEFGEALRTLAKQTGITLEQSQFTSETTSKKEKIYALNHLACEFYHYILTKHTAGEKAKKYLLEDRKISEKVLNTFMLGYAPRSGNALVDYLIKKKKYTKEDILASGLATQKTYGILDFFINRLMFPLYDHRGNIIGFSGRLIEEETGLKQGNLGGKYINTRETLVYHKGDVFFGLNSAKEEIKKGKWAIIMEGEFDVISAFQEGIGNAIAVKGTALTENQVNLIARFAEKVSLCFDMDKAGKEAMKRSFLLLEKKGLTTTVVLTPNGKDPDEAIKLDPFAFKQAVKHDKDIYDFFLEDALMAYDIKTIEGKKQISTSLLPIFGVIENEIIKEHFFKKLAHELDTSYESVVRQVAKLQKHSQEQLAQVKAKDKKPREEMLEIYLLALVLQHPNPYAAFMELKEVLADFSFKLPAFQKIITILTDYFIKNTVFNQLMFVALLPSELIPAFDKCYLLPLPVLEEGKQIEELKKVARELKMLDIKNHIKEIGEKIKTKEKETGEEDNEEVILLQIELAALANLLKTVQ